jgi:hypothetical protein
MACDITKGEPCKDSRIGIKSVDFAVFNGYKREDRILLFCNVTAVFRYQVKGTGNKFEDVEL